MKHTKGPWEIHEGGDYRHVYGGEFDHSGAPLAEVPSSSANAHLIAAAPELLQACEAVLRDDNKVVAAESSLSVWTVKKVLDAIAKAKGES